MIGLAILAFGFLPIGLPRSLAATYAFYLAAVPGFLLVVYAVWPWLHRLVRRLEAVFERLVFDGSPRLFAGAVASVTLLVACGLSYFLFDFTPRIPTGIAHWFHARILASGALYGQAPPVPEFFGLLTVVADSGRWYSIFPLGHTALVAGALKLGAPWIVNPLCGAAAVVLFYLLGKELFGERTGRLAALFGLFSPFLVFMSSEFYNDASSLVFCTAFLLSFARATKSGRLRHGLLAGVFLGLAVNTRPVTALAASLPLIGYSLWLLLRAPRRHALPLAGTCVATLAFVALLLASNYGITGDALATGYAHASPVVEDRAFDPAKIVPSSVTRVLFLNRYLFQWAIPSLLPVALLFASGRATR
ncbi:MAG TPA: glycosyltransferase family 39 protein, partial [Thermoanaerobaculia bacterium]|nr:glycosyltransferase family 39 protein [Thermoanaerobaculia bacterium]